MCEESVDDNGKSFKSIVSAIFSKYTPIKYVSIKPPWWSTKVLFFTIYIYIYIYIRRYTNSEADYAGYALKRNQVKHITSAKVQHNKLQYKTSLQNLKHCMDIYKIKAKLKPLSTGQLEKPDGSLTDGENEVAEILNDFFNQFSLEKIRLLSPSFYLKLDAHWMKFSYITEIE